MTSAILTQNLSKSFRRVHALSDLSLEVPEASIFGLVGPNGAGKTTAIKILMNILQPTSGQAQVLGWESAMLAGRSFCSIGYVSENQKLPNWMRVGDFLAYLRPFYPTWDRDLEDDLVRRFDLERDRKLKALSRGMRMKVALAGSLAYRPRLLVMDEPFSGLDPLVRDELIEGIRERAGETTVFVSSHDLAEVETLATHVGYLEDGHLRFSEAMNDLAGRFREVRLKFDAPSTLPATLPDSWLQAHALDSTIRFIESRYDREETAANIQRVFGEVREATYGSMTLRSIFLAMARSRRTRQGRPA
jgi:ABC-2 type transport system ATP-binding protein